MNINWIQDFVKSKISIAKKLNEGECLGSYSDAIIILASVISSIASELWPGKNIDRKRFIELCVQFADSELETKKISIPLLMEFFHKNGDNTFIKIIKRKFHIAFMMFPGNDTLVITGKDVDLFENEILELFNIDILTLRKYSYSNLFYTEARSSLVHKYELGHKSSSRPMSMRREYVSYVNRLSTHTNRMIHFSYKWVENLVLSISENIEKNSCEFPYPKPDKWWIDA